MNKFIGVGRLVRDPELNYLPNNGTAIAKFTIAINRIAAKDGQQKADFLNCVVFGKTAENCANYLTKGSLVAVDGRIQVRSYEQEGQRRYATEVVAEDVRFLDTKKKGEQELPGREVEDEDIPF